MEEKEFNLGVPNDINVRISNEQNPSLLDEKCCTVINVILTNDGKIATSFLGSHNPFIVTQLEHATKVYFKELKKKLRQDYKEYADLPEFNEDDETENIVYNPEHHHSCSCGEDCSCGETHKCSDDCNCTNTEKPKTKKNTTVKKETKTKSPNKK